MKKGILITLSILLSACVSTMPSFQSKENLSGYNSNKIISLNKDAIYKVKKGMVTWYFGVRRGDYLAKYQDEKGYYFEGVDYSSCMGTEGKTGGCASQLVGGIWQSKSNPNDFRMYYIDGSNKEDISHIQGYALTRNKYVIETESEDFSKLISVAL